VKKVPGVKGFKVRSNLVPYTVGKPFSRGITVVPTKFHCSLTPYLGYECVRGSCMHFKKVVLQSALFVCRECDLDMWTGIPFSVR
jgi:hypothetical protein